MKKRTMIMKYDKNTKTKITVRIITTDNHNKVNDNCNTNNNEYNESIKPRR